MREEALDCSVANHPASMDVGLKGIRQNKDSMITDKEMKNRLKSAIKEYDKLRAEY